MFIPSFFQYQNGREKYKSFYFTDILLVPMTPPGADDIHIDFSYEYFDLPFNFIKFGHFYKIKKT